MLMNEILVLSIIKFELKTIKTLYRYIILNVFKISSLNKSRVSVNQTANVTNSIDYRQVDGHSQGVNDGHDSSTCLYVAT